MRIRASRFLGFTLFLALVAGPTLTAQGSTVTIVFGGTLKSASNVPNGVAAGDTIAGTLVYSTAQGETGASGLYTFNGTSNTHAFQFQLYPPNTPVANQSEANELFSDSYSGESTSPFKVQMSSSSSTGTDFVASGDTGSTNSGTFSLTLADATNGGGYSSTNLPLPTAAVLADFATTQATLVYTDGFTAVINSYSIYTNPDGSPPGPPGTLVYAGSVPEPSSLVLAILGSLTAAVGNSIARRNRGGVKKV